MMMMRHSQMMWFCGALMVIAIVFVVAGGGAWAFLAPLACVAMMGMMAWMMVRMGRRH
ncbi:MAG TPA: hypothetical protein VF052_00575 [Solirubrobacterales bacterium]